MSLSLRPEHVSRYRDIAALLLRHGRRNLSGAAADSSTLAPADEAEAAKQAERLAADLEELGPTFIKLGQLLSTRPDILPGPYLDALARLQDRCQPVAMADIRAVIESDLRRPLEQAFPEFDAHPVAAASLGQVHFARLPDGRRVAVKVQRPGVEAQVREDLAALLEVAGFADRHTETGRRFGLEDMVDEFRRAMLRELDYEREAANQERLADQLAEFRRLCVPLPVPTHTTGRVLTMDVVDGVKITDVVPGAISAEDGEALADELFAAYLKQVLVDGFFHADPHPGNVFLADDGRLALIDVGMVAHLASDTRRQVVKLVLALGEADGGRVADHAIGLGEPLDGFDRARFRRRVADLVADQQALDIEGLSAGRLVAELTRIAGDSGLRPLPQLSILGKALLNLDEVARLLAPHVDPNRIIRERAGELAEQRMRESVRPASLLATAMEAKEFAERLPERVSKVMDTLAEGEIRLDVKGIDERDLMRGLQKLANRITTGLVLGALIVGAAMLSRVDTDARLFGYPALAMVTFCAAALGGFGLLISIVWGDRRDRRDR